jgi:hypothetical protein
VLVKRATMKVAENATIIARPSKHHAEEHPYYRWVRFDGSGIPEIREVQVGFMDIKSVIPA